MFDHTKMQAYVNGSKYQKAIYDFVADPNEGNLIVIAGAGCGKTSTSVAGNAICTANEQSTAMLAFNAPIAKELKERGVNGLTFHSACYTAAMSFRKSRQVEIDKTRKIVDEFFSFEDKQNYRNMAVKLVGLAKQSGIGAGLLEDSFDNWAAIADHHMIEPDTEKGNVGAGIELAHMLLERCNNSKMVDFDDMLYFVVKYDLPLPKYNWIWVDEAQDTNAIQRVIIKKMMLPNARLVAVGDPNQAIYGFRGADSRSMQAIKDDFNCKELPLSVTYRCATSIVSYAQQWVKEIEARPNATRGQVLDYCNPEAEGGIQIAGPQESIDAIHPKFELKSLNKDDLVVCRFTKPLISMAYKLIRERIPCMVKGRDIGEGLISLIRKMKAASLQDLEVKISEWRLREIKKALDADKEEKAEVIADKADSLLCVIESLSEDEQSVDALIDLLKDLFDERKKGVVVLATIHKAKGLEAERVIWLARDLCPMIRKTTKPWQKEQELNLCYVAATRAKETLVLLPADY